MREESNNLLEQVRTEGAHSIDKAKELSEDIEGRARRVATKVSVEEAQKQFEGAQTALNKKVKLWALLSAISVLVFIFVAYKFSNEVPAENLKWGVVFFTAIRIAILSAIGAVAAFFFRILRAHLHMREQNLHRQRIANSLPSFVDSAVTPEQRDLILTHLVDAVASFGSSGLLTKTDDSISPSKVTIDTIARTITGQGPGSSA